MRGWRPLTIHYRRLPDRVQRYDQWLVVDDPEVKVSIQTSTPLGQPLRVGSRTILEPGSAVVWFTFPGRWHDIGRFHRADGTFTGWYANVLTPVELHHDATGPCEWRTTDLALDVWKSADGQVVEVMDRDEFEAARTKGWLNEDTAQRAAREAERLAQAARRGLWPPTVTEFWTLERVLQSSSPTTQADDRRSTST